MKLTVERRDNNLICVTNDREVGVVCHGNDLPASHSFPQRWYQYGTDSLIVGVALTYPPTDKSNETNPRCPGDSSDSSSGLLHDQATVLT
ncbi:hypothetical protein [Mycolicibacterium hippocampi]|uniref:hypothetical protein n=1 Tax=Mycolicibacterium hippocampi TaxID=659824 RepID=UPI003511AB34